MSPLHFMWLNLQYVSSITHHFNFWYGKSVANALQDLQKPHDFTMEHIHVNYSVLYGKSWLSHSYDIMFSHLMHVLKQDVLNCLHIIPSHLRPSYNTHSTHSCCSALLHHIWAQISYFASLSQSEFLGIFLSVFPYNEHYQSVLTEHLLHVEHRLSNPAFNHPRKKKPSPHKPTERMATCHTPNTNISSTSKTDAPMDVM